MSKSEFRNSVQCWSCNHHIHLSQKALSHAGPQAPVWPMHLFWTFHVSGIKHTGLLIWHWGVLSLVEQFPVEYTAFCQPLKLGSPTPLWQILCIQDLGAAVLLRSLSHCRFLWFSTYQEPLCFLVQASTFEVHEAHLVRSTTGQGMKLHCAFTQKQCWNCWTF